MAAASASARFLGQRGDGVAACAYCLVTTRYFIDRTCQERSDLFGAFFLQALGFRYGILLRLQDALIDRRALRQRNPGASTTSARTVWDRPQLRPVPAAKWSHAAGSAPRHN